MITLAVLTVHIIKAGFKLPSHEATQSSTHGAD